jgi:hypothetical protein
MKNPKQHSGPKKSAGLKRLNASPPPDLLGSKTPDWHHALKALRHGQTKPLGELLPAGGAVPIEVLKILGMMLAPSPHYRGTRLMAVVPKRWTDEAILKRFVERVETSQEIIAALQKYDGQKEAAIVAVAADRRRAVRRLPLDIANCFGHARRFPPPRKINASSGRFAAVCPLTMPSS